MQSLLIAGRRGVVAAADVLAVFAAMLILGLLAACGAPAMSDTRTAVWDRYVQAAEAYSNCRLRGRTPAPCKAGKAASQAAEARYRAEIGATAPTRR